MEDARAPLAPVAALLRGGVVLLVVVAPLPFGSVEPLPLLVLELVAAFLGGGALLLLLRDSSGLTPLARRLLVIPAVLGILGLAQLIPLPTSWLAPPAAEARRDLAAWVPEAAPPLAPWSVSPPDTADALLRLAAYAAVGLAAAVAFRDRAHARPLAAAIAASGAFQAIYGCGEYLTGNQHIFGFAKRHYLNEATGTLINRNHFAELLAMSLPFALALALAGPERTALPHGWRRRLVLWLGSARGRKLAAGAAAAAMWVGVLLSYSRTGLAAALLATVTFFALTRPSRRRLLAAAAILLLPTVAMLWLEVRAPGERFTTLGDEVGSGTGRTAVWRTSLELIAAHPFFGHGLGAFESAYAPRQTAGARGRYDHAHSDWIESAVEGGAIAFLAAVALFLIAVPPVVRARAHPAVERDLVRAAAAAAVCAVAVHSLTDFPLRIPAIAALLAVVLGLLASPALAPSDDDPANLAPFRRGGERGGR